MNNLLRAVRWIGQWIAGNLARFAVWAFGVAIVFALVLAMPVYQLVREEGPTTHLVAGVLLAVSAGMVGLFAGGVLAAYRSLASWVTDSELGPMVSKALFAQTLGVSDKRPEGKTDLAKSLSGITFGEAKERLTAAFSDVFTTRALDRWLPAPGRWLASRVVNGAGWLAARAAIEALPGNPTDETKIDLIQLRDQVGAGLEQRATSFIGWRVWLTALVIFIVGTIETLLVTWGVRELIQLMT